MADKKIYCGSGKQKTDTWLKITINPDKIMEYTQTYEGKRFVKLDINLLSEPNQFGKDVEVTIDNWRPDRFDSKSETKQKEIVLPTNNDDLPF